jgi:hypothetical protein
MTFISKVKVNLKLFEKKWQNQYLNKHQSFMSEGDLPFI